MDVGRAFTFAFEDPEWSKKLLVGGMLLLIPIFGWLVVGGYWMRIIRNTYAGHDAPLPEWDRFGEDFILGLKGAVALLIWWLPYLLIFSTLLCLTIPFAIAGDRQSSIAMAPFAIWSFFGLVGVSMVSLLFQVAMLAAQPMVLGRVAVTESVGSAFEVSEIISEARRVPVSLLVVIGLEYGVRSIAGFGVLFCIVGVVFTYFAGFAILSHLYGQLRREIEQSQSGTADRVVSV